MKAQVDYQKRKSIYEALAEQQRAGNFGAKGMSASVQQTTGKVPKVIEDVTIVEKENLKKSQIGEIYIVKTKDKKTKAETLTTVEIIADANGNPTSKVLIQQ